MSLRNIINRLKNLQKFNVEKEVLDIIKINKSFIVFILQHQMSTGIDGDGAPTRAKYGSFYSDFTENEKIRNGEGIGKNTSVVTNYMTGDFYESLTLEVKSSNDFVFSSKIPYFEEIILRSTKSIMKLNKESSEILLKEIIEPQLKIRLEKFKNGL